MLCAVSALGKVFVTTDMSTLAGFTALAGLRMAPTRRSTTGAGHFDKAAEEKKDGKTARLERVKAATRFLS